MASDIAREAQCGGGNCRAEQFEHVQCDLEALPQLTDQAPRGDATIREGPRPDRVGRHDRKTFLERDAAVASIDRKRRNSASAGLSLDPGEDNIQVC